MKRKEEWWAAVVLGDAPGYQCGECGLRTRGARRMLDHLLDHVDRGGKIPKRQLAKLRELVAKEYSYDDSCLELARGFLVDHPKATPFDEQTLAQYVQEAVEAWLEDNGWQS